MKREFEEIEDIQQEDSDHSVRAAGPAGPRCGDFPHAVIPLTVGRETSVKLINEVQQGNGMLVVLTQRDKRVDSPVRRTCTKSERSAWFIGS